MSPMSPSEQRRPFRSTGEEQSRREILVMRESEPRPGQKMVADTLSSLGGDTVRVERGLREG